MKKRIFISILLLSSILLTGCSLPTLSNQKKTILTPCRSAEELVDKKAYVWEDIGGKDLMESVEQENEQDVFFPCVMGSYNFRKQETSAFSEYPRTIWMTEEESDGVPTITGKNALLYVSEKEVPEEIVIERFGDYGYTIGIANLIPDLGDHYYIQYTDLNKDDYKYYLDLNSDAKDIVVFDLITRLYLDKVGDVQVNKESVSKGGTVNGLGKGKQYVCEFYTGTYYQDFLLTADIHTFGSMERFVTYDFSFLHSNCIKIEIPEYFKSGYYLISGVGMFRYIAPGDEAAYENGTINYNDPIILKDEFGNIIYDPRTGTDNRYLYEIDDEGKASLKEEPVENPGTEQSDPGLENVTFPVEKEAVSEISVE